MKRKEKIYLLIIQHKLVSLNELEALTKWKRITVLRALAPLLFKRHIRSLAIDGNKYFYVVDKPL